MQHKKFQHYIINALQHPKMQHYRVKFLHHYKINFLPHYNKIRDEAFKTILSWGPNYCNFVTFQMNFLQYYKEQILQHYKIKFVATLKNKICNTMK